MSQIKCLLGGGAGLIGSNLSRHLLDKGYDILIADDFSESHRSNVDSRAKSIAINLANNKDTDELVAAYRPDYIFSLQAMAAEVLSDHVKNRNYVDNTLTTVNLLNAAVNYDVKKITHFSSVAVFAGYIDPPFYETTTPRPHDSYGLSKYLSELECKLTKEKFGLDYSIVRAHNVQGRYVGSSMYRNFIAIICRQALNGEDLTLFGSGLQSRQFSSVKYICDPLEKLMTTNLPIVHLGADKFYTVLEVAQIVQKIARKDGKDVGIVHLPERKEAMHAGLDHSLAREKLGFVDETDIEELCYDVYNWMKEGRFKKVKKAEYEITKGLPPSWL